MKLFFCLIFFASSMAFSQNAELIPKGYLNAEHERFINNHNENLIEFRKRKITTPIEIDNRPFAEYEKTGYLIFSDSIVYDSLEAKIGMAKNLPNDVHLIIYTQNESNKETILKQYSKWVPENRLHVFHIPVSGSSFWARDGIPVPTLRKSDNSLEVVDARYYHWFEPDQFFAEKFNAPIRKHEFFFEGGNFATNSVGDCLVVERSSLPTDDIFRSHYGCKKLIRLPFVKGIGHADESVKFINSDTVLTDTQAYADILSEYKYKVVILPKGQNTYETYVNSLLIENTLFMPKFGNELDAKAQAIYESLGFKVIALPSYTLSNSGRGSIHCITMTYPKVDIQEIEKILHARKLN